MRVRTAVIALTVMVTVAPASAQMPPWRAHIVSTRPDAFCVYRDRKGFAWICSDQGLLRLDGTDTVTFGWNAGLQISTRLRSILRRSDGALWVGGETGVLEFVRDRLPARVPRFRSPLGEDSWEWGTVHTLIERADSSVWCGTDNGLVAIVGGSAAPVPLDSAATQPAVHAMVEDDRRDLWIGASNGLYRVTRDGRTERFTKADGLPDDRITAVAVDSGGTLWLGTDAGLARVERDALQRHDTPAVVVYTSRHGLPSTAIRDVQAHGTRVWVATADGATEILSLTNATLATGFQTRGSEVRQVVVDDVGDVWLTGPLGIRLVTTGRARPSAALITSVALDGVAIPSRADGDSVVGLRVPWHSDSVAIHFVSPFVGTRVNPDSRASFRYQVRNAPRNRALEADPIESAVTSPFSWSTVPPEAPNFVVIQQPYTNLRSGTHRFAVRMQASFSYVDFTIVPPLWVRWWFIAPLGFAVGGVAYVRRRAHARHRHAMATLRAQIASDLHDSVGARMSRIALLTDVARQNSKGHLPLVSHSLDVIGEDARALVDEMNDAVWLIDNETAELHELIVRARTVAMSLFDHDGVRWDIDADAAANSLHTTAEQRRNLFLILKEALTNIRKHARASVVTVRITLLDSMLRIDVDDDGVGCSRSAAGGNGLRNMQRRAADLGGTLTIDRGPQSRGTRITLLVPMR